MTDENVNPKVGTITWIAVLLTIAIGVTVYYLTKGVLVSVSCFFVSMGVYEVLSSLIRSRTNDQFGVNDSDAAILWGFVFLVIGGVGLSIHFSNTWIVPVLVGISIAVLYLVVRLLRK